MCSQANLCNQIERAIPALYAPLHVPECERSVYKQVEVLSRYIATKASDSDLTPVRKALYLMDELYSTGNTIIRGAIENVFVFSLSSTLYRPGVNRERLLSLIPVTFCTLYMNQVLQKGC